MEGVITSNITKKLDSLSCESIASKLFYLLLAASLCYLFLFFLLSDIRQILTVVTDDAAYFFKIAENVATGKGLTFDGINKTNGFQPLWLYVLIPVYSIYHGSPEVMYRVFLILQLVFLTLTALIIYSIHSKFYPRSIGLISSVFFFLLVFFPSANGMESALLVLALAILFAFGWRGKIFNQHNPGREFVFGVLLGLVLLSRLDMVFLAVAIYTFCFFKFIMATSRPSRRENLVRFSLILTCSILVVIPYLLYNYLNFGSIMPISGVLKSSFPIISFNGYAFLALFQNYIWYVLVGVLMAFCYLFWFFIRIKKIGSYQSNQKYFQVSMAIMSAAVLLHFLHTILFMKWAVFYWHFIPYGFFVSAAVSAPAFYFLSGNQIKKNRTLYYLSIVMIIIFSCLIINKRYNRPLDKDFRVAAYNAAIWAKKNTNKEDVFALSDAGVFSYFSQRSVINLDGIVNNLEYQEALKKQQLKNYLKEKGVRYFILHFVKLKNYAVYSGDYETFAYRNWSHKYMVKSDEILLKKINEVYRSPYSERTDKDKGMFIVWKLSN